MDLPATIEMISGYQLDSDVLQGRRSCGDSTFVNVPLWFSVTAGGLWRRLDRWAEGRWQRKVAGQWFDQTPPAIFATLPTA